MEISEKRIREGFPGQRSVVLPRPIVASWLASGPLIDVVPSDVGFYPHAKWHFVERSEGISQAIIIYCADGDGWGQLGDSDVFPVRSGEALLIPRDTIHTYGSDAASPWTIYWVHVSGPKAETLLPLLEVNPCPASPISRTGSGTGVVVRKDPLHPRPRLQSRQSASSLDSARTTDHPFRREPISSAEQ